MLDNKNGDGGLAINKFCADSLTKICYHKFLPECYDHLKKETLPFQHWRINKKQFYAKSKNDGSKKSCACCA